MPISHPRSPEPIDSYVGNKLRQVRNSAGKSQTELADAIGITFQQVQKYENGINRISIGRLYKIARFLGVSFDYFVEGYRGYHASTTEAIQQQKLEEMLSHKSTMKLALYFHELDDKSQQNILGIMEQMARNQE